MNEQALQIYTKHVETEVTEFLKSIDEEQLNRARQLIGAAKEQHGRLHITGIGKPSHVAEYMCALFSSTGTPCYFLDGTEAVHGSAGQVLPEDVVIAISNSGNTIELQNTVEALQRMGVKIISVTGNLLVCKMKVMTQINHHAFQLLQKSLFYNACPFFCKKTQHLRWKNMQCGIRVVR